jgi:hypothetical protein
MLSAPTNQQDTNKNVPQREINLWCAEKRKKGNYVVEQKASFCQGISQRDGSLAETAFPF